MGHQVSRTMEPKLAYNVVRFYFTLYQESKVNSHQFIEQ
ncbi:hypothetical protein [Acinetobacter bereziniae]|nr:hypothetical protein [Acinetobacter bereziniae]